MNLVVETIKKRRSIRGFKAKQIKDSDLQILLDCAMNAPSACNMQSWHFSVIQDTDVLRYLNDAAKEQLKLSDNESFRKYGEDENMDLIYGAPTLIIVSGNDNGVDPLVDCSAAVQNMLLAAQSLGLGTLWNGFINLAFKTEEAKKKISIPDGYTTYYGIAVGFAKDDFKPANKMILKDGVVNYIK